MLVVVYHGQLTYSLHASAPSSASESYIFAFGSVGVHIFFVISGFIMVFTSQLEGGFDAKAFIRRRIIRIYPIYWICIGLYLGFHALIGIPYGISLKTFFGALLLLPGDASAIIGPAWTLSFEMFFYIVFALAMLAGLNRGLLILTAAFLSMIAAGVILPFENATWKLVTNTLLLEFIAGAAIGWLLVRNYLPARGGIIIILIAVTMFAGGMFWGYTRLPSVIMWGVPSALLVCGAVIAETGRTMPAWVKKIGYFGDSSYALYLIHILVITGIVNLAESIPAMRYLEPAFAALLIGAIALAIAELLHHQVERPMLRLLNLKRQPTPLHPA